MSPNIDRQEKNSHSQFESFPEGRNFKATSHQLQKISYKWDESI
jgi:hypothetical protein